MILFDWQFFCSVCYDRGWIVPPWLIRVVGGIITFFVAVTLLGTPCTISTFGCATIVIRGPEGRAITWSFAVSIGTISAIFVAVSWSFPLIVHINVFGPDWG